MKTFIVLMVIAAGYIFGAIGLYSGLKKHGEEYVRFNIFSFLKKSFKKTPFNEFSGAEIFAFGILSIFAALIITIIYFDLPAK